MKEIYGLLAFAVLVMIILIIATGGLTRLWQWLKYLFSEPTQQAQVKQVEFLISNPLDPLRPEPPKDPCPDCE